MSDSADPIATRANSPARARRILSLGLTTVLLIATGALCARVSSRLRPAPTMLPPSDFAVTTDPMELRARQRDAIGKFVTGTQPGDRVIEITADGRIRFSVVGPLEHALESSDRYRIGTINRQPILATDQSGVVEMVGIDRLKYFGDVYERAK